MQKVTYFGSAFNPPHLGHMDCIKQLSKEFDVIIVGPSYKHAFGKDMIEFKHRMNMLQLLIQESLTKEEQAKVIISNIEEQLAYCCKNGPIYSYDVIDLLFKNYGNCTLAIGEDNYLVFDKFYKAEQIKNQFGIVVTKENKAVRSTLLREKIKQHQDITEYSSLRVNHYIQKNHLYQV